MGRSSDRRCRDEGKAFFGLENWADVGGRSWLDDSDPLCGG